MQHQPGAVPVWLWLARGAWPTPIESLLCMYRTSSVPPRASTLSSAYRSWSPIFRPSTTPTLSLPKATHESKPSWRAGWRTISISISNEGAICWTGIPFPGMFGALGARESGKVCTTEVCRLDVRVRYTVQAETPLRSWPWRLWKHVLHAAVLMYYFLYPDTIASYCVLSNSRLSSSEVPNLKMLRVYMSRGTYSTRGELTVLEGNIYAWISSHWD